ncbi:MAG: hypothetical protein Q8L48_00365 [Archangium sp.]|nr:hypothetical protein [Archangium sp.]
MLTAFVLASLTAAPHKLAAPEWSTVNIPADLASFYAGEVARVLRGEGFEVISSRDIATVLGFERQKQLLGCAEDANACMTELGAALGCDGILTANLARLDDTYQGSLRILSTDGRTLADERVEATGQKALAEALEAAALRLVKKLRPQVPPPGPRRLSWIPLAAGVALGVGAGVSLGVANSNFVQLDASGEAKALQLANEGKALQGAGWAMAGVGAAALAGAALMFALGGDPPPVTPQVSVTSGGAALSLTGAFP